MDNMESYQNCWDYWHCKEEAKAGCPVVKNDAGRSCWVYTDNLKVFDWSAGGRDFKNCLDCPWYKHLNRGRKVIE